MAHLFLQDDPKVSVAGANDAPATIPTPEQLGSLLVTYAATGSTAQSAAAYAALAVAGTSQWVPIAGAGGVIGPTGGGTPNQLAKFVTPGSVGNSQLFDNGTNVSVPAVGALSLSGSTGVSVASGAAILVAANTTLTLRGDAGVNVDAPTGNAVVSASATGTVSVENPNASVTVGTGGGNNNIDVSAGGNFQVSVTGNISLNGALFLGAFSVATLPPGITQAMAFATDVRNLDSGAAYPTIEAVGTGGLVVRFTDGVWRLSGTNITAQA